MSESWSCSRSRSPRDDSDDESEDEDQEIKLESDVATELFDMRNRFDFFRDDRSGSAPSF